MYVNEIASCSVMVESSDVTLENFREEILNKQVDDVLDFSYKFSRIVNNKRVVIGLKQERFLKLKQCIIQSSDQGAIYLVREEANSKVAEEPQEATVVQEANTSKHDKQVQPAKKAKISRQPTLLDMCTPNRSTVPSQQYSAARARRVKIFSEEEIAECTGMQKAYREFWNTKAEELCSSSALKTFKPGEIQGAINVAWTMQKTEHLKDEMTRINQEIDDKCSADVLKKFQLSSKTLEKNRERVETATSSVQTLQREMTSARQEYFVSSSKSERRAASVKADELEIKLESQLAEMRKAQDDLRKAIDARRRLLNKIDVTEQTEISSGDDSGDNDSYDHDN